MVVQHNLTAMNSNRMLGLTSASQSKSTEKLSSGYKINRAADDAAGLSISEKMRKQIRGLTQASLNAQDGISAVQTAEGALTEVHDMLQRMNELAVKAANGTNSEDDRKNIQDEIDQLVEEIDRVSETTKFNETYLLKGGEPTETTETIKTPGSASFEIVVGKEFAESYTLAANAEYYAVDAGGNSTKLDSNMTATDLAKYINANGTAKDGYAIYEDAADATNEYGAQLTQVDVSADDIVNSTTGLMDASGNEVTQEDLKGYFDPETGVYNGALYSRLSKDGGDGGTGKAGDLKEIGADQINSFVAVKVTPGEEKEVTTTTENPLTLSLHVGADSTDENQISVDITAMSAKGLGIDGLKVDGTDDTNARAAIDTITAAIKTVSAQRSALGAVQNRLEHTINNLDNVVENTTAAESQIRDTDMATEMVRYSNNNILAQAGQAMLAQANQANQGVLSLLS